MNAIAQTEFNPYLAIINGVIKTTSLKVADHFGKQHKSVLRSIKNLDCSSEFSGRNFALTSSDVIQPNGGLRKEPSYELTRDGFTFLAMGFTGKEAAKWKEAYINAFNKMEAGLLKYSEPKIPTNYIEALQSLIEFEKIKHEQEEKIKLLEPQADALKRIAINSDGSYCIRDAAKVLQIQEKNLKQWLIAHRWIYRRPTGTGYLAYSAVLVRGYMEHKMATGERLDGTEWSSHQARLTAKGIAKIAYKLGLEVLGEVA